MTSINIVAAVNFSKSNVALLLYSYIVGFFHYLCCVFIMGFLFLLLLTKSLLWLSVKPENFDTSNIQGRDPPKFWVKAGSIKTKGNSTLVLYPAI